MARRMKLSKKLGKKISYELIDRESPVGQTMYALLDALLRDYHHELRDTEAQIALAWCTSWKPDADGRVTIGKCKKASDLDREVAPFDFVVLLSKDFWTNPSVSEQQKQALLDHELMHATVKADLNSGEVVRDERGRPVFRVRKHDVEEFRDIVARYGTYKRELEQFASALRRAPRLPLEGATVEQPPKRRKGSRADAPATAEIH